MMEIPKLTTTQRDTLVQLDHVPGEGWSRESYAFGIELAGYSANVRTAERLEGLGLAEKHVCWKAGVPVTEQTPMRRWRITPTGRTLLRHLGRFPDLRRLPYADAVARLVAIPPECLCYCAPGVGEVGFDRYARCNTCRRIMLASTLGELYAKKATAELDRVLP